MLTDLINEDMIKEILSEFAKGDKGTHKEEYADFIKMYPSITGVIDNDLYR